MEIGFAGRVPQPPVRKSTTLVFNDRGQRDPQAASVTQGSQMPYAYSRLELEPVVASAYGDFRSSSDLDGRHSLPVGTESVARPVERGREIEFVVAGRIRRRDESLEACVLPKGVRPFTRAGQGNAYAGHVRV